MLVCIIVLTTYRCALFPGFPPLNSLSNLFDKLTPVRTVCVGTAASMAAILFASGTERGILPHGKIMIHDPLTTGINGSALTIDSLSRNLMETRQITAGILAKHTGRPLDEIFACTAKDTYFNAQEAVGFGLADYIVEEM